MPTEHDPFAPHHTVTRGEGADEAVEAFPEDRLTRAGVEPDHIDRLREWYDDADPAERDAWREEVRSAPDAALTGRLSVPEGMDLDSLTKDQLEHLLRARSLPVSGNKPDLIARLEQAAAEDNTPETPSEPAGAPEGGSPAEEPADPESGGESSNGEADGPPPNEQPTTAEPVTGAQQPPQPPEGGSDPFAPQPPVALPPVAAPAAPEQPPARRSTHRAGGTGRGN